MALYDTTDPFSVCFNMMKIKYSDYDEYLTNANFLNLHDKVNIFINLETVFKYLSMINDLEKKLILQKKFDVILVSNIINLAAHYKRFFMGNGFDTRIYLYHTDFNSKRFIQRKYNEDYRLYYLLKYNDNPKFVYLTDSLKSRILKEVKAICEFIPRVYYISGLDIEGSEIPYVIGNEDPTRKNIILSGEFYDTQYSLIPNYFISYFHSSIGYRAICNNIKDCLKEITKRKDSELDSFVNTYNNYGMYCSLLSVLGDRSRSIDGLTGIGPKILEKTILQGLSRNELKLTTNNPELIGNIFHDNEMKTEFINNYYCSSIVSGYDELMDSHKLSIFNQRKDRLDVDSLVKLNATRFNSYPLILEILTQ